MLPAISILEKNMDKVNWKLFSGNSNAIEKIWIRLVKYKPAAIHILDKNLDKVNWEWLSENIDIFA
jgi:hypothetical protein